MLLSFILPALYSDFSTAHSIFFYVEPQHRTGFASQKLLHAFQDWAQTEKADIMTLSSHGHPQWEAFGRWARSQGFSETGAILEKDPKR